VKKTAALRPGRGGRKLAEQISAARGLSPFASAETVTDASIVFSRLTPPLNVLCHPERRLFSS